MKIPCRLMFLNVALVGILSVVCLGGCPGAVGIVAPAADAAKCLINDVLLSKPIAQIAVDCGMSVAQVIEALLASKDPQVLASHAYGEASAIRESMSKASCGK